MLVHYYAIISIFFGEKKREMRDMWDWSFPFRDKFWSSEKVHTNIGSKIKTIWYKAWSLLDNASNSEVGFIIQKRPRDVSLSIAIIMSLFRGNHNIHEKTVQWKQQQKKIWAYSELFLLGYFIKQNPLNFWIVHKSTVLRFAINQDPCLYFESTKECA